MLGLPSLINKRGHTLYHVVETSENKQEVIKSSFSRAFIKTVYCVSFIFLMILVIFLPLEISASVADELL